MKVTPLRRRLFLLVAAGVFPLAVASVVSLLVLTRQQRGQAERAGIEITRALSTAVDFELRRTVSLLEVLGTSIELDRGDAAGFHEHARRMLALRPEWEMVILADAAGEVILGSPQTPRLAPRDLDTLARIATTVKPAIGDLTKGSEGTFHSLVGVPVARHGKVEYLLAAALKPEAFLELVKRQRVPSDWVVSVFDSKRNRVARSRAHNKYVGSPAAPSLSQLMAEGGETGTGITYTLEGDRTYTAYHRLRSGWSVAIGLPPSLVEAGARRSLALLGGGILLSLVVGVLVASRVARGIVHPIRELRDAARSLGLRETVVAPTTSIEEIEQVASALIVADEARALAERDREQLLEREREARATAEAASQAKDQFLAMLGHELRNPLGAIATASQLLDHPRADAATRARAQGVVRRQVEHLTHLVDDLLDAGRAVLGKIVLHSVPVDLAAETERTIATLEGAGKLEGHRLERDLTSVWVEADVTRLEQIIANLLTNAIRYTPPGGGIRVSVRKEGDEAVLRVADEGIGMTAELAARAFELFVQGDRELDRAHGGLGIGLTLVRRLTELQGGRVNGDSPGPDRGSTFTVRLPAIALPRAVATDVAAPPELRGCDVLIVEDNEDARTMLREVLEIAGHRVRVAVNGPTGLAAAVADPPEVALVDIGLPELDGYEVARRIRRDVNGARRPFLVALTGYGLPEDRERALAAGFDAHLVKPVDEPTLRDVLARAVASAR